MTYQLAMRIKRLATLQIQYFSMAFSNALFSVLFSAHLTPEKSLTYSVSKNKVRRQFIYYLFIWFCHTR